MDTQALALIAILVAVLGSAWKTSTAIADLRERMAQLEGRMDSLANVISQVFAR